MVAEDETAAGRLGQHQVHARFEGPVAIAEEEEEDAIESRESLLQLSHLDTSRATCHSRVETVSRETHGVSVKAIDERSQGHYRDTS